MVHYKYMTNFLFTVVINVICLNCQKIDEHMVTASKTYGANVFGNHIHDKHLMVGGSLETLPFFLATNCPQPWQPS